MTYLLIALTVIVSILCMQNESLFNKLKFNAYMVWHRKEYYRLLTHGFVHAGWGHLIVNMFVLYFFGRSSESVLKQLDFSGYISMYPLIYVLMYLLSIVFASSISLFQHKHNHWYNSVGASGAVAAVLFFFIFFNPWEKIYMLLIPIPIPGIVFAVLYLAYSHYMSKKGSDNVNHDAHLLGALFGFVFPLFIDLALFKVFLQQLTSGF